MFQTTVVRPLGRALGRLVILFAVVLPQLVVAAPMNPWYSARLDFSSAIADLEGAGVSFSSSSPDVSLIRQGSLVTGVQWALGQVNVGFQGEFDGASGASPTEQFAMTVGNETLLFNIGSVFTHYGWYFQLGLPVAISGGPAPYHSPAGGMTLVTTDYKTLQPFFGPSGTDPSQGLFVANSLRMEFIPFLNDPAFSLLQAISDGNGGMPLSVSREQIYAMDIGTLTVGALPAVPEPTSIAMVLLGLGATGIARRRRLASQRRFQNRESASLTTAGVVPA